MDGSWSIRPPIAPPGASLQQNVRIAYQHHWSNWRQGGPVGTLVWFYFQVRNGAIWDYKQDDAMFEGFGNFNFGVTGAAAGIPEWLLRRGAGFAQIRGGNWIPDFGHPLYSYPYGDDPGDQAWIGQGIAWYRQRR